MTIRRDFRYSSSAPLWLSHVRCIGNESGLEECSHLGFGDYTYFCDENDDIGVVCIGTYIHMYVCVCTAFVIHMYAYMCVFTVWLHLRK